MAAQGLSRGVRSLKPERGSRIVWLSSVANRIAGQLLRSAFGEHVASAVLSNKVIRRVLTSPVNALMACEGCLFLVERGMDVGFCLFDGYEEPVRRVLRPSEGDVVIDVGAFIGRYAITAAKAVGPDGLVVAIEPHPTNFKILMKNVRLNRLNNVICLNCAAWDRDGHLTLYESAWSGHHSLLAQVAKGYIKVRAKKLDSIAEELGLGKVDWAKIDVEGAELRVLKGMRNILRQNRGRLKLMIEVHGSERARRCEEELRALGYKVKLMRGFHVRITGVLQPLLFRVPSTWLFAVARH